MVACRTAFGPGFVTGAGIAQSAKMQDAGTLSVTAPELGQSGQITRIKQPPLSSCRIRAEQTFIYLVRQAGCIAVTIKTEPGVFVNDYGDIKLFLLVSQIRHR